MTIDHRPGFRGRERRSIQNPLLNYAHRGLRSPCLLLLCGIVDRRPRHGRSRREARRAALQGCAVDEALDAVAFGTGPAGPLPPLLLPRAAGFCPAAHIFYSRCTHTPTAVNAHGGQGDPPPTTIARALALWQSRALALRAAFWGAVFRERSS